MVALRFFENRVWEDYLHFNCICAERALRNCAAWAVVAHGFNPSPRRQKTHGSLCGLPGLQREGQQPELHREPSWRRNKRKKICKMLRFWKILCVYVHVSECPGANKPGVGSLGAGSYSVCESPSTGAGVPTPVFRIKQQMLLTTELLCSNSCS